MNNLAEIRSRLSFTQGDLAKRLGKTQGNIGHYETGKQQIPVSVALRLIEVAKESGLIISLDEIYLAQPAKTQEAADA